MSWRIDKAKEDDIDALVCLSLEGSAFQNQFLGDYFDVQDKAFEQDFFYKALKDADKELFVAKKQGTVVGMCLISYHEKPWLQLKKVCQIDNICVNEAYRGQGIGRALVEAACAEAKKQDIQHITLGVFCKNEGAISFYQKVGFHPLSIKMERKLV